MHFILDAIQAAPPADVAKYALIGAFAGAVLTPLILFVAIKLNLKGIRSLNDAARLPQQSAGLFRLYAKYGAGLFAILAGSQPVLDAAGENEVYVRDALIPVILIVIGWPFVRALRRLRETP